MIYDSVDKLQKVLVKEVFHYSKDAKKAAGRALGTLVEIITYYLMKEWDFATSIAIERRLPEYGNREITHNVEYSLHPIINTYNCNYAPLNLPITRAKLSKQCSSFKSVISKYSNYLNNQLLCERKDALILRNSCTIAVDDEYSLVVLLDGISNESSAQITMVEILHKPFVIVECKRVGVEEGIKKGPQTIEKAKQGAYVARTISSLQKFRDHNGQLSAILPVRGGEYRIKSYVQLLDEIIASEDPDILSDFIMTIGVASNHGNWFTSDDSGKELLVLAQSYDWLLFLTDAGISDFINDLILSPSNEYQFVKESFRRSYTGERNVNEFTKVNINYLANLELQDYFHRNISKIENWFNVITPPDKSIKELVTQLKILINKDWLKLLNTEQA
ncbi:MAG: hypothetical protein ACE5I5_17880 [Candidatus Heimdallarchaeota archaeon]